MEIKEIPLQHGQYLTEVYYPIESNVILNKRLSGVGATHSEIITPRHSIIIVPNVPIITCKVKKHKDSDNLFGVMQNVSENDIEKYLVRSLKEKKWIKIMVTPESFHKVRDVFDEINLINMYESCFLLLDECHKFIKERDFRKKITYPIPAFFKFKNKALVSATPIIPSDPRFEEQKFKIIKLNPPENTKFEIILIETDDIERAFFEETRIFRQGQIPQKPYCIFVNSATIIAKLITQLGLKDLCSIFCSAESAIKLKYFGFKNIYTEWKPEYENKIMFFTSRFYTGLDIWLDKKPIVLYFSDSVKAPQTIMDPFTDMAQACGRFRNGMEEIRHFVVFNKSNQNKTKDDLELEVKIQEEAFYVLKALYDKKESLIEKKALLKIIQTLPFNEIFTDGEIDYFLKDNYVDSQLLQQQYSNFETLWIAYGKSGYFYNPLIESRYFHHADFELEKIKNLPHSKFQKEQRKAILDVLENIACYGRTPEITDILNTLKSYDKIIVEAFYKLGAEFIRNCDYKIQRIKQELLTIKKFNNEDEAFYQTLLSTFKIGKKYLCKDAKRMLREIYDKFNITPPKTITSKSLKWHFEIDETVRIGNNKAIKILHPTAKGLLNYLTKIKHNTVTERNDTFGD